MVQTLQPIAYFRSVPPPVQAAIYMVAASLLFAALSATIRHLSTGLHTFEVTFFRNFAGLVFMLPWLVRSGLGGLRTGRFMLYGWRSFLSLLSMLCGFTSLTLLPFDKAIALSFTVPLFATAGAALILREDRAGPALDRHHHRLHRRADHPASGSRRQRVRPAAARQRWAPGCRCWRRCSRPSSR